MSIYRTIEQTEFEDIASRILYEDNHYLILNKRSGEIVQGDKTGDECLAETLKAFVAQRDSKPGAVFMGVAHRLDRPVSGAVLFAKTSKGLERINALLRNGGVHKTYWAVVCSQPPVSESQSQDGWTGLTSWLYRNEKQNKTYIYKGKIHKTPEGQEIAPKGYKAAKLKYRFIKATDRYFIVEVQLLTGRHHQIRAQLASIGCPIKGDLKYGAPRSNKDGSISLHARYLEFKRPIGDGQTIQVTAPLPEEFSKIAGEF
ncbi:MAG: RluA family pseudouridine synthase [Candidatus Egerieousia sp.]